MFVLSSAYLFVYLQNLVVLFCDYPLIALKRLTTRSIGPPLLTTPAIMLASAQQPMMPATIAKAIIPVLEISMFTLVAAVLAARLLSVPVEFFIARSKIIVCFDSVTKRLMSSFSFCYDPVCRSCCFNIFNACRMPEYFYV